MYTAAGRIIVNPGEDKTETRSETSSTTGGFNVFTMDASIGVSSGKSRSESIDYQPSQFHSGETNVFRVGDSIELVIPQITGTRNVFDSVLVLLENKVNEREVHSESHGVTISTNLAKTVSKTLSLNAGRSDSHDTFLNDAYIRGAVDFMNSQVRNQGCLAMNITNKGASYEYVPGHEVHDSRSFAIGLSGLDLSSADAFAYSLGRSIASAATSAGVGMLASETGLGGFVSTLAASLAGTYVNTKILPQKSAFQKMTPKNQKSKLPTITSNSTVSFEHNGRGFSAVNLDFDKAEFEVIVDKIKGDVFAEALDHGLTTEQAVQQVNETVERFTQEIEREQAKIGVTAEQIETTENDLRDEVREKVGGKVVQELTEGEKLSSQDSEQVAGALSKAIERLERYQIELNLRLALEQSKIQQASLQAQNELIDGKVQQYQILMGFLNQSIEPTLTRSNSTGNLLQDTYIRQGQRVLETVTEAFSGLSDEADSMSMHDYVELQRSRLPVEARDNPEVLARLAAGRAFYKGGAQIGKGLSTLDDATGNVVSGAMQKLSECSEWIGTHTRRFVRDNLGLGQRVGQNVGDIAQISVEIFVPGTVGKGIGSVGKIGVASAEKIVGIAKFRSALGTNLGLFRGKILAEEIGLRWTDSALGKGGYGLAFENYIATLREFKEFRLPVNFKTFDFWSKKNGRAISVKTLDTNKMTYLLKPSAVYSKLKEYIDKTLAFTESGKGSPASITAAEIKIREIRLGIPADTGAAQWTQIQRAVKYGKLNNVKVIITEIG